MACGAGLAAALAPACTARPVRLEAGLWSENITEHTQVLDIHGISARLNGRLRTHPKTETDANGRTQSGKTCHCSQHTTCPHNFYNMQGKSKQKKAKKNLPRHP